MRTSFKAIFGAIALLAVAVPLASADTIEEGKIQLREDFGYATSPGLWAGTTSVDYNNKGQIYGIGTRFSAGFGLKYGLEIDARLSYLFNKMNNGTYAGHQTGDVVQGLSEWGVRVAKDAYNIKLGDNSRYNLTGYLGAHSPGQTNISPNDLLALSDGYTDYDIGVVQELDSDAFGLVLDSRYINRPGPLSDQVFLNLSMPLRFVDQWQFGPMLSYLQTFYGVEIGSTEFNSMTASTGAPPFQNRREIYTALGAFVSHSINEMLSADVFFLGKIAGANTDRTLSFGAGVSYTF